MLGLQANLAGEEFCSPEEKQILKDITFSFGLLDEPSFDAEEPALGISDLVANGREPVSAEVEGIDLADNMQEIRHQGTRGTCVAHALVRCHEFNKKIQNCGSDDLSEQFAYWHMKERDGTKSPGTSLTNGAQTLVDMGTCLEKSCAYEKEASDSQHRGLKPEAHCEIEAKQHRAEKFFVINERDISALTTLLSGGVPIAYGLPVYDFWTGEDAQRTGYIQLLPSPSGCRIQSRSNRLSGVPRMFGSKSLIRLTNFISKLDNGWHSVMHLRFQIEAPATGFGVTVERSSL